jgi:tetratricopeptide (TPR) repeat protein
MLRYPSSTGVRIILLAASGLGLGAGWGIRGDEITTQTPRPLMRLPRWIESLNAPPTAENDDLTARRIAAETILPVAAPATAAKPVPATPSAKATTGSESGGFKQWISERMAALPKPTSLLPGTQQPTTSDEPAEGTPSRDPVARGTSSPRGSAGASAKDETITAEPAKAGPATVTAPVAATPDELPVLSIDAASFRGVQPGKTSRKQLEMGWGPGEAFAEEDGTAGLAWKLDPFERVEVTLADDTVAAIRIKLTEPVAVEDLAKQLEIGDLRTVSILDEQGVSIGNVYPERGVILSVKPGTQAANAILIEPLDPESFVLRAEGDIDRCSAYAVADLQYAITLDPKHVRAHRLLLALTTSQGKWQQSLTLAEQAVQLDPADVWTQLKLAGVYLAVDRPEDARAVLEAVRTRENVPPLVAAQTERLLGRAALAGKLPNYQQAVDHYAEAIRKGGPLLAKKSPAIQSAAREVVLDAHLGTAIAIAKGTWQQKSRVIPKWISRSEMIVKEFEGSDAERQILELQLCRGALAAAAGSSESIEPLPWVKRLIAVRDEMDTSITDPWRRRQIDWETGQGLADALTSAQKRGDASDMLDNATLTAAFLERGAEHRELTAPERKAIGDLLFRVGIMYSLQKGDHATAVTWFDRVVPLWEENDVFERDGELGRQGESYVSMAISYWQVDRREDAMALSRRGVDLMVTAVDKSQLEERALAVAYGNLSTMYAEQGDDAQSQTYAEMASRAEATGTRLK